MNDAQAMIDFIEASPSPYHCVLESIRLLKTQNFVELDEQLIFPELKIGHGYFCQRGGSLIAWRMGEKSVSDAGFRMMGAHTDSPNIRIKPNPDAAKEGFERLAVEPYGGLLKHTWLDRDLGFSGRVILAVTGGQRKSVLVREDRPVARIPNLAIHLNRGVSKDGAKFDAQKHLAPVLGLEGEGCPSFKERLADKLDVDAASILTWDIGLHSLDKSVLGGYSEEFIFAPRLDNQASCFQALSALLRAKSSSYTQMAVLFDHEEVGSRSATGAMGSLLKNILVRIESSQENNWSEGGIERAISNSWMISMDMAHGVHPNYADLHEPLHKPMLNGGPVIKQHVEQRYATDAESSAFFKQACMALNIPFQDFVIRSDLACGSTIGPIASAGLAIRTVDVGGAMLSMHSIREQCGAKDVTQMIDVLVHILEN